MEVHQVDSGSSDIVFGMVLNSIEIQDSTPPSAPGSLQAIAVANDQVDLSWTPGVDPQSGIQLYRIYRGGVEIGTTTGTTFSDMTVSAGNTYTYEVSAVNNKNLEGPRSLPAVVNVVNIVMFQNGAFPNASYSGTDDTWIQGDTATGNFGSDPRMDADGDSGGFGGRHRTLVASQGQVVVLN